MVDGRESSSNYLRLVLVVLVKFDSTAIITLYPIEKNIPIIKRFRTDETDDGDSLFDDALTNPLDRRVDLEPINRAQVKAQVNSYLTLDAPIRTSFL